MSIMNKAAAMFQPRASSLSIGPIGVDFGLEAMHMVQLEAAAGQLPQVRARTSLNYELRRDVLRNPHQFRSLIRRALAADNFYGRKAVIAMPSGMFRTLSINYQSGSSADQQAVAVIDAMKNRVDGDLADYVIDYMPVKNRSKSDERLALVAVSERDAVVEFLDLAGKARLDVQALEIGPVAISRLVGALAAEQGAKNVLVINTGRRATYLTLISGTDLLFDQEVAFGENGLIRQAAETLDMAEDMARDLVLHNGVRGSGTAVAADAAPEENALVSTISEILKPRFMKLVEEIKRVCLYAAAETRGGGVPKIYLLGSIARWPGTEHLLGSLIDTDVAKIPDPLALFPQGDRVGSGIAAPEIVVATGAALRGMKADG